jgi:hypothetical protein
MTASPSIDAIQAVLFAHHGLVAFAAKDLGMARESLHRRIQRSTRLQAVLASSRETVTDLAESRLIQAIDNGEPWAVALYLRTRGKDRGYVEPAARVDITAQVRMLALAEGLDPDEAIAEAERLVRLS